MDESIEETGTVPCPIAGDDEESRVIVEEQQRKEIREVARLSPRGTWGAPREEGRGDHAAHL